MGLFDKLRKSNIVKIIPLKSVNGIEFGLSREQIRKQFGKPKNTFKKTNFSKVDTDDYGKFHIYYDDNYNFEYIEIFNEIDIYFENNKLSKKYSELLQYFKNIYGDIEEDESGFTSKEGSLSVYKENDDDIIDAIGFGKKGYYN